MSVTAVAYAAQTLTVTGQPLNTETVVIGGKTYTFQTSLTNSDGNVKIGADASGSLDNLKAAINLDSAGAGTTYAAAMTAGHVKATTKTATTLKVVSRVPGSIGNLIGSTETLTNGSWGASTLASGSGSLSDRIGDIAALAANSAIKQLLLNMDNDSTTD